jgi:hypothetical protein
LRQIPIRAVEKYSSSPHRNSAAHYAERLLVSITFPAS